MILFGRHAGFTFIGAEERRGILKNLIQEEDTGVWGIQTRRNV